MDARIQIHRTRWLGRFLALLSLAKSCRVQATELLGSSGKRSKDPNNIFALGNLVRALIGLFLSSIPVQASAAWDAGTAGCFTSFQTAMAAVCAINNPDSTSIPGSVYYRDSCVMTSIPNFTVYAHAVDLATGNSFSFAYTLSLTQCDFTISLSGGNKVEPSTGSEVKTLPFIATVKNRSTGQPPTNPVNVDISLKVDPTSGGHAHGKSDRPRGGIAEKASCDSYGDGICWSKPTDRNDGTVVFNFNAPEASGKYTITATCEGCTNNPQTAEVKVKVAGLEIIPDSSFYMFVGDINEHSKNHYLTPDASTVLRNIAISYRIEDKFWQLKQVRRGKKMQYTYTPSMLNVNDASLEWGGKFDIHGKWKGDHKGHRRGIVADVRANQININNGAIPLQSFTNFQKVAASYDAVAQIHCSDKTRIPPTCIVNGTEDDGRHFHVLLLGDDQ